MSLPLEDYALIGDGHTAALVSRYGAIDWLCWPRFDSDALFCSLVGTPDNGHWTIAPEDPAQFSRRYLEDTLILETTMATEHGSVKLIDFMPSRSGNPRLVRIVAGVEGRVRMRMHMRMRFGYGQIAPWMENGGESLVARIGPDLVVLHTKVDLESRPDSTAANFVVRAGERHAFVLSHGLSWEKPSDPIDPEESLRLTERSWREWIGQFDNSKSRWPEPVRRSLITLKAMIFAPSGGLVAAPTTSLPEAPGGKMNWDYRFCWLRDATFTLGALLNAGFHEEATAWRDWLLRAVGGSPDRIHIMYRVDGGRRLDEHEIPALSGYRHAKPVRIGNAAATQNQIDVLGELLDGLSLARKAGVPATEREEKIATALVHHLEKTWEEPDSGIWESRGEPRPYTYSKAMAWVGVNRYLRHYRKSNSADRQTIARLAALEQRIHRDVCEQGWNPGLNTFTEYYGGETIDASLLLLPLVNFLPPDDPRMIATVDKIGRELGQGGLIRRRKPHAEGPNEGAFIACSCWMADCLRLQGRGEQAVAQFERVLDLCNDVGLLSEQYNVPGQHLSGNFPQALSHLALVNTALGLSGPVLERGGP